MIELKVLQAVRLKGRVQPADVATTTGEAPGTIADAITAATQAGYLVESKTIRLSIEGRSRLSELLADERAGTDGAAIAAAYDDFRNVNAEFKALVSDWQLKDGEPNSHEDKDYDGAILSRLAAVHQQVRPIIGRIAVEVPRLSGYSDKLEAALAKVQAGDLPWLTRPIMDSYHTVWFELHEELILAAGLTREAEAQAGHAN
ncbi:conserved hypothetical protein [Mycolicibacter sinensis]|uniref:Uncharacterized protein n=1 Tax=Mycolicibacter sinensis (strain JDM601) TaxID=875328 RepID=F5Z3A1_MYCSD|nr:hypothetical protein [Mycolicibacter sinensis]AEF37783.1 conserved hypothetical protein [Mycolicibacter sinensis]